MGRTSLYFIIALGAFIRLARVTTADFPLNDGGMFVAMTNDILSNGYRLPAFTSYNGINAPFAYPPLGFYVAAWLSNVLPVMTLSRFLPMIFNILSIPAFYLLARTLLGSDRKGLFATLAYALLPRSFKYMIMGGGLSRAPGLLFVILLLWSAYLLYNTNKRRYLILSIVFASLTALSHPEFPVYAGVSCVLFMVFYQRNKSGIINTAEILIGTLLITSVWWIPVVSQHGISPFISAFTTGEQSAILSILILLSGIGFIEQSLLGVLAMIGGVKALADKQYLLPVWVILVFIVGPRSALTFSVIIAAMLVAITLDDLILPMLNRTHHALKPALCILLVIYSAVYAFRENIPVVSDSNRTAMQWINTNTPIDSKFIVVSGQEWYQDSVSEWFPVLSGRNSITTVQGYEWLPSGQFEGQKELHKLLQQCNSASCLEVKGANYLYVARDGNLNFELITSGYELLYKLESVTIWKSNK